MPSVAELEQLVDERDALRTGLHTLLLDNVAMQRELDFLRKALEKLGRTDGDGHHGCRRVIAELLVGIADIQRETKRLQAQVETLKNQLAGV